MKRPPLRIGIAKNKTAVSDNSVSRTEKRGISGMLAALIVTSLSAVYLAAAFGPQPAGDSTAIPAGNFSDAGEKLYAFLSESEFLRDFLCMEHAAENAVYVSGTSDESSSLT